MNYIKGDYFDRVMESRATNHGTCTSIPDDQEDFPMTCKLERAPENVG